MRIGLDLDGCFYNLPEGLRQTLIELKVYPEKNSSHFPNPLVWDFMTLQWGMTMEEYKLVYNEYPHKIFSYGGAPKAYKKQILAELQNRGHELIFITNRVIADKSDHKITSHRLERATEATMRWFRVHRVPHDEVIVDVDKVAHMDKVDIYLDDSADNLAAIEKANDSVKTVLYSRPYNDYAHDNYRTVDSIWDFYHLVLEEENEDSASVEPVGSSAGN